MKIETMNLENAKLIREILNKELTPILEAYGLEFDIGNSSYDDDSMKINGFVIKTQGGLSQVEKDLAHDLKLRAQYSTIISLDGEKIHTVQGKALKLFGFKTRARKRPYIAQDVKSGDRYELTEKQAEAWFGIKEVA